MTRALLADDDGVRETAEAVRLAEERGDDVALEIAHIAHGLVLSRRPAVADRDLALEVLRETRDAQVLRRNLVAATMADIRIAELTAQGGEVQGAIESACSIVDQLFDNGRNVSARCCHRRAGGDAARQGIGHRRQEAGL